MITINETKMTLEQFVSYRKGEKLIDSVNEYAQLADNFSYADYQFVRANDLLTEEAPIYYECLGVWEFANSLQGAKKLTKIYKTKRVNFSFEVDGKSFSIICNTDNGYMEVGTPSTYVRCQRCDRAISEISMILNYKDNPRYKAS